MTQIQYACYHQPLLNANHTKISMKAKKWGNDYTNHGLWWPAYVILVWEHSFTNMNLWCLQISTTTSDTISTHCVLSSALHLKHWQWQESMIRIYWGTTPNQPSYSHHVLVCNVLKSSVLLYLFIQFTLLFYQIESYPILTYSIAALNNSSQDFKSYFCFGFLWIPSNAGRQNWSELIF